jgi:Na+-driven multidrug efflux pump
MGDVSIAAVGVSNTVNDLVWVGVFGVTNAAAILVGKTLGEGHRERAYLYAKRLLATGLAGGMVLGLILLSLRIPLVGLFTGLSQATRDKAQVLILIAGLGLCMRSINCVNIVGVLRSGGDTMYSMLLDAGTMWLLSVPLVGVATLVFHWPIEIVYCLTYVDELLKLFIGLPRFASRKWIHVLTQAKEEEALGNA